MYTLLIIIGLAFRPRTAWDPILRISSTRAITGSCTPEYGRYESMTARLDDDVINALWPADQARLLRRRLGTGSTVVATAPLLAT
jgi:hypothetical protein